MRHAIPNSNKWLMVIACLLMVQALPAFAHYSDAGVGGFSPSPVSEYKSVGAKMAGVRMPFVGNEGRMDERVRFHARTFGGEVFVTRDGAIVYNLPFYEMEERRDGGPGAPGKGGIRKRGKGVALRETFVNGIVKQVGREGKTAAWVNYFSGRDARGRLFS